MDLDDIERIIRKVIREELDRFDKNQNQLFTVDEAAQYLKVSRTTIYVFMKPNGKGEIELPHVYGQRIKEVQEARFGEISHEGRSV